MTSPWSWEAAPSSGRKDSLAWFSGSASASHPFTVCYLGVCPRGVEAGLAKDGEASEK